MTLSPAPPPPVTPNYEALGTNTSGDIATIGTTFPAGADGLAADLSFTADGVSDYLVTVFSSEWYMSGAGNRNCDLKLDGGQSSSIVSGDSGGTEQRSLYAIVQIVKPAKGVHTVNARFYCSAGTLNIRADASQPLVMTVQKVILP